MEEAILNFNKQFGYEPVIENGDITPLKRFCVGGMGGSHLSARLLRRLDRSLPVMVRSDYGLPKMTDEEKSQTLFIASSYSGNTEETVSFFEMAIQEGRSAVAITTGGRLLELAREHSIPFILLPNDGIQPRMALGYALLALLVLMDKQEIIRELRELKDTLDPLQYKKDGETLAGEISGKVPLVYSSTLNRSVSYIWKIIFNETGKIPAFTNVFPELNHNEMEGFDVVDATSGHSQNFAVIMLKDRDDHPRITKRMELVEELYEKRGIEVISREMVGGSTAGKIFASILTAAWTGLSLAKQHGVDPEQVALIEEFKKQL